MENKKKPRGFTLIELLVTIAVVAILSAIAIPSYTEYVRRAHLADAQQAMASNAVNLEQIFADKRAYPVGYPPTGTTYMAISYTPSADARSFALKSAGAGKMASYFLAQTSGGARCKCEKCAVDPFSAIATTASSCPSGSSPW